MDIRGWTLDQIAQLEDWVFGARFAVSCWLPGAAAGVSFDISEILLPEVFMVWGVWFWSSYTGLYSTYCRVGLGSFVPSSEAAFMDLEPLIHGFGLTGAEPRKVPLVRELHAYEVECRFLVFGRGRRLCYMVNSPAETSGPSCVVALISSVPKEIPDWVLSG